MSTQKFDMSEVTQVPPKVTDSGRIRLGGACPSLIKAAAQIRARSSSAMAPSASSSRNNSQPVAKVTQ
jgi:hypothetical protein